MLASPLQQKIMSSNSPASPTSQLIRDIRIKQSNSVLEQVARQLEFKHQTELNEAREKHDAVQFDAQQGLETMLLERDAQKTRERQAQADALERARQQQVELEQEARTREVERLRRLEQEAVAKMKLEREEWEMRERIRLESEKHNDWIRQQQEESERKAQAESQRTVAAPTPVLASPIIVPPTSASAIAGPSTQPNISTITRPADALSSTPLMPWDELEVSHQQYLALHQRLKALRKRIQDAYSAARKNKNAPNPFDALITTRREIVTAVGRLAAHEDAKNYNDVETICQKLMPYWNSAALPVNAADFIIMTPAPLHSSSSPPPQISSTFIYLISHLAKAGIRQAASASRNPSTISDYALAVAFVFSQPTFRIPIPATTNGINSNASTGTAAADVSFRDIMLAKMHRSAPLLFGICGSAATKIGRQRLGYRHQGSEPEQDFQERFQASTYLFAAMTMHGPISYSPPHPAPNANGAFTNGFMGPSSSSITRPNAAAGNLKQNVFQPWMHWSAVAAIVNTPAAQFTTLHARALQYLLKFHAWMFLRVHKRHGAMALTAAVVDLPKATPQGVVAWGEIHEIKKQWLADFGLRFDEATGDVWKGNRVLYK